MTADCDAIACLGEGAELLDAEFAQALAAMPKPPPPPADVDPEQLLLGLQPILAGVQKEAAALLGERESLANLHLLGELRHLPLAKGMKITERTVPASDGYAIPIRIYVPESNTSSNTYPLTVYLHEGAFCVGNLDTEEAPCRALCASPTPSVIVNVAYRLAPMYRWPTAEEDCWTVLKWLVGNVGTGADSALSSVDFEKGFVLGGASAGALVTCKLTQRAVVDSLTSSTFAHPVKITGQILHIPTTIAHSPRDPTNEEIDSLQGITDDEKATLKDMKSWADTRGYPDFAGLPVTRPMVAMFDGTFFCPSPSLRLIIIIAGSCVQSCTNSSCS